MPLTRHVLVKIDDKQTQWRYDDDDDDDEVICCLLRFDVRSETNRSQLRPKHDTKI